MHSHEEHDAACSRVLQRAFIDGEIHLGKNSFDAEALLLKEGLAFDNAHAVRVCGLWRTSQRASENSGAESGSATQLSTEAESEQSGDQDVDSLADLILKARRVCYKLYPGLVDDLMRGAPVHDGDLITLKGAGLWVTRGGKFFGKRIPTRTELSLEIPAKKEDAQVFRILNINRSKGKMIEYGKEVELIPTKGGSKLRARFACPGRHGIVHCLDNVQIFGTGFHGRLLWSLDFGTQQRLGGRFPIIKKPLSAGEGSTLFFTIHFAGPARRIGAHQVSFVSRDSASDNMLNFSVMVYNVWLMPQLWNILPILQAFGVPLSVRKFERASLIPDALLKAFEDELPHLHPSAKYPDVLVLCEAFCDRARPILKAALKRKFGLCFETMVGGSGPFLETQRFVNSGVILLSRFPITDSKYLSFGSDCSGDERLANKGVTYARILKNGRTVHIFATHLQAWETTDAISAREAQLLQIRRWIQRLRLDASEPVLIAGDLNVCRVRSPSQYVRMLDILAASDLNENEDDKLMRDARTLVGAQEKKRDPKYQVDIPEGERKLAVNIPDDRLHRMEHDEKFKDFFSFNSVTNTLASGGPSSGGTCALLDYVLASNNHRQPSGASCKVLSDLKSERTLRFKKMEFNDLSDHYPVLSRIRFTFRKAAFDAANDTEDDEGDTEDEAGANEDESEELLQ